MMRSIVFAAIALSLSIPAMAAKPAVWNPPKPTRLPTPSEPTAIALYGNAAPGSEKATQKETWESVADDYWVRNVTKPTITPFFPKAANATGAAVIVAPGGGFEFLSIKNEGTRVAQALADRGVAAFVLKYRVLPTPENNAEFMSALTARIGAPGDERASSARIGSGVERARPDAQAALRLIRTNAAKWGIDPKRIGILGFSAGAFTTMATALADAPGAQPDFIAPIYGAMIAVTPPAKPQPMFVALAGDDPLFGHQGFGLVESWKKAGGSVELHFYSGGGHGFGASKRNTTSDMWFDQFMDWMKAKGFLKPKQ
ncbi:alpha/beta hydrolase [Sphingomonas bisphenolicum]|uniref:Endo-1,4-beta-xylanase n=1 Tax=Sphingomonas bisphenolicum TaxID=296544 RepID=A0ABN5WLH0_9SPHN|nr:alpha/beta hydrolase [Sphingomonas bisphenolicum]BBF72052.1 endo-1,4-beta-xylanase [Sphingomonas bisphenolicum]